MIKLKVKLFEYPNLIIEVLVSQTRSIRCLIKLVHLNNSELSVQKMQLSYGETILDPTKKISDYKFMIPGALLI